MSFDFSSQPTRKLVGLQIFQSGTQTDSLGREKVWSPKDLDNIKRLFDAGSPEVVYIKLGHCSPEHVTRLSKDLEIPNSILLGEEGTGRGAAALGKVTEVFRHNDSLVANVEVPEKIANFINSGFLTGVSCEIIGDYKGQGAALSALALLGAERPAIKNLIPLTQTAMLDEDTPVYAYDDKFNFISLNPFKKKQTQLQTYTIRVKGKDGVLALKVTATSYKEAMAKVRQRLSSQGINTTLQTRQAKYKINQPGSGKSALTPSNSYSAASVAVKLIAKNANGLSTYTVKIGTKVYTVVAKTAKAAIEKVRANRKAAQLGGIGAAGAINIGSKNVTNKEGGYSQMDYAISYSNAYNKLNPDSSDFIAAGALAGARIGSKLGSRGARAGARAGAAGAAAAATSVKLIGKAGELGRYLVKLGSKSITVVANSAKEALEKARRIGKVSKGAAKGAAGTYKSGRERGYDRISSGIAGARDAARRFAP